MEYRLHSHHRGDMKCNKMKREVMQLDRKLFVSVTKTKINPIINMKECENAVIQIKGSLFQ